jgi:gliding-associated putative ABC transporter substrate-binding component GldG
MKSKSTITYFILLASGVIILLNILSNRFFFRLDLTEDGRYTLSKSTKNVLKNLDETVTITAYFSKNLPPDRENIRRDFKDMLVEYSNIAKGMVVYEFVDPLKDENIEQEAVQAGIMPQNIPSREKDEIKFQKGYMGAYIQLGEESEVIPVIESSVGMEYNLTTAIKKLSLTDKPLVGILQGHGEATLQQLQEVIYSLEVLYSVQPVTLTDSTSELDNYNTLAIVAPKDSFPDNHLRQLDAFIARGGRIFVAINRVGTSEDKQYGIPVNTGLETWLSRKGIDVNNSYIVDAQCHTVALQSERDGYISIQPVQFYYIPVINNFEDHPISSGLEQVLLEFASSLNFAGDSSVRFIPLARTSENSGTKTSYSIYDLAGREWTINDFPISNLVVAAALEGNIGGSQNSKMVVVGDGDFPLGGRQRGQINPDNVSLMVNSIDWLSDDTGLIELRTKGATSRPLDDIEDGKRTFLKYLNFLLPLILIIIYGIIRMQRKQTIRIKRMEAGYV